MFTPLRAIVDNLPAMAWPTPAALNPLAAKFAACSGGGKPLRFVAPAGEPAPGAADYELHIHDDGRVPLRAANRHDAFNALVWLAFPQTKAMLNRIHADELRAQPGGVRSVRRDALTLFDESGVLVLSSDPSVLDRIRAFEWKRLFWDKRETLARTTRFLLFGHALYEKALAPYVGMTGHALLLEASATAYLFDDRAAHVMADQLAAQALLECIKNPRDLSPLPVLGVPGWWHANIEAAFYDNTDYFRAGRSRRLLAVRTDVAN